MERDLERGGLYSMLLSFLTFVGGLTVILSIWVIWVIQTRESAVAGASRPTPGLDVPAFSHASRAPPLHLDSQTHSEPNSAIRQRRVSFKASNRPLRRLSSESGSTAGSGSSTGSSIESALPMTPDSTFVTSPIIRSSILSGILSDDGSCSGSPTAFRIAPNRRFSGFKALARGGSRSRGNTPTHSRATSPEPGYRNRNHGAMSDTEASVPADKAKSFVRIMRNLGHRHKKTKSDAVGETSPLPSPAPPPSAFRIPRPTTPSIVTRAMRRSSLTSSPKSPALRTDPYGPEINCAMPEPRRRSLVRSPDSAPANPDLQRLIIGSSLERPSSAPIQRPQLKQMWTSPLDRHQRQAQAVDQFGVWSEEFRTSSLTDASPKLVRPRPVLA